MRRRPEVVLIFGRRATMCVGRDLIRPAATSPSARSARSLLGEGAAAPPTAPPAPTRAALP